MWSYAGINQKNVMRAYYNTIHSLCHAMLCLFANLLQQVKAGRRGIDMVSAEAMEHLWSVACHTHPGSSQVQKKCVCNNASGLKYV